MWRLHILVQQWRQWTLAGSSSTPKEGLFDTKAARMLWHWLQHQNPPRLEVGWFHLRRWHPGTWPLDATGDAGRLDLPALCWCSINWSFRRLDYGARSFLSFQHVGGSGNSAGPWHNSVSIDKCLAFWPDWDRRLFGAQVSQKHRAPTPLASVTASGRPPPSDAPGAPARESGLLAELMNAHQPDGSRSGWLAPAPFLISEGPFLRCKTSRIRSRLAPAVMTLRRKSFLVTTLEYHHCCGCNLCWRPKFFVNLCLEKKIVDLAAAPCIDEAWANGLELCHWCAMPNYCQIRKFSVST